MATSAQFKVIGGPAVFRMMLGLFDREDMVRPIEAGIVFEEESRSVLHIPLSLEEFANFEDSESLVLGGRVRTDLEEDPVEREVTEAALRWLEVDHLPYYRCSYHNQTGWLAFSDRPLIPANNIFGGSLF
jgi:hypothetical protein